MLIGTNGETFIENCFTTFMLLLTVGVFAYLISTISTILDEINKEVREYKHDLGAINRFSNKVTNIYIIIYFKFIIIL